MNQKLYEYDEVIHAIPERGGSKSMLNSTGSPMTAVW